MRQLHEVTLSERDRNAVIAAARLLKERYPVEEVILFGSKARGEDGPDSDLDLLVLTSRPVSWDERASMVYDLVELGIDHDVLLELLIETRQEWLHGLTRVLPIRRAVDRDGALV